MDNPGETHYVSFLSGERGGMGNSDVRFHRGSSSARNAKRYMYYGLRVKAHLLVAAFFATLLLCCVLYIWIMGVGNEETVLISNEGDKNTDMIQEPVIIIPKDFPTSIYEWTEEHFTLAFNNFMTIYKKSYTSLIEKQFRYRIFKTNMTHIHLHNEQGYSYELGMNKFGDWTREEFARMVKGFRQNLNSLQHSRLGIDHRLLERDGEDDALPTFVDWRAKGCVTKPKDQGQCGSCWAFSATGAIEGGWCIKKGKLLSLSEQMLMDCSRYLGNNSCNGGLMDDAFSYVTDKGICTENAYPYEAKDNTCRESKCHSEVRIKGFYDVPPGNEEAMKAALARHGPVSIAIQADQIDFQFYKKGIFDAPCGNNLDHGVLLVGYGTDSDTQKDFFIMKNSWGTSWGEGGYMLMARHKGKEGQCGLLLSGSYPLIEGEEPPRVD